MQKIYQFDDLPLSEKHGTYGGSSRKEGVLIDGENWIIKYASKRSVVSEYIGSRIYEMLGFDVQEVRLGVKNGRLVIACKDIAGLVEYEKLRNTYCSKAENIPQKALSDIEGILLSFEFILRGIKTETFWDWCVVDIFLGNPKRNWGVLKGNGLAPVFGNGKAFSGGCAYTLNGKRLSARELLSYEEVRDAAERVIPNIEKNMGEISDMILAVPETFYGISVIRTEEKHNLIQFLENSLTQLKSGVSNAK